MNIVSIAKEYASNFHKDDKRLSGKLYIEYLNNIVERLKSNNIDDETILASTYLKYVLRKSPSKKPELESIFSHEIVNILEKYKELSDSKIKEINIGNKDYGSILKAYLGIIDDYRVLLIRIASKVEDSYTLIHLPKEHAQKVALKLLQIYAPIARIISFRNYAVHLENNAFKFLNPELHYKISKKLSTMEYKSLNFLKLVVPTLKLLLTENNIKVYEIKTRLKHVYGIYRKQLYYKQKGKIVGRNYEGIHDILGLRIIVENVEQCYKTEDLLRQLWDYITCERDDYIQVPRASGYRAIHNVFKTDNLTFETQILTNDMYYYNEFGPAKHSVYKIMDNEKGSSKDETVKKFLKEYLDSIEKVSYEEPKINVSSKIYIFTPKGDIIELKQGSNIIDFAYAIHADVGNKAVGGMINGINAKLTEVLKNGDKVEVKTLSSKKYPSEDWIKVVKTSKARTLIRRALKKYKKTT